MSQHQDHWENIYQKKDPKKVGWYQAVPTITLELLAKINATPEQSIIDVGCGAALLVDELISQGYKNISLLDLSKSALASSKLRLGDKGHIPEYFSKDISHAIEFQQPFDIWHDRAVFHFLTNSQDRSVYMDNLQKNLSCSGHAIIGTFSLNGPTKCSGLDIVQYDEAKMRRELASNLVLLESIFSTHLMPSGNEQEYQYFIIKHKNA